jgi:hypothetical protein
VSVADNCPANAPDPGCHTCAGPTVSCDPPSGTCFPNGTTTVTCIGRDGSGNTDTKTFQVIVTDQQPPEIVCPPFQVVAANCTNTASLVGPTATDNCTNVTITCSPPLSSTNFGPGIQEVCCNATDKSGNGGPNEPLSSCCFDVLVVGPAVADIIWHAPTAEDPANHDTDPHQTSSTAYKFTVGKTIPVQVHAVGCFGDDVTDSVCGRVEVYFDSVCMAGMTVDITENDTGVGGPGGEMEHKDHHLKYDLKTDKLQYPLGTVNNPSCFELHVVIHDCTSGAELRRERIIMESK